jgi:hypothetical protein
MRKAQICTLLAVFLAAPPFLLADFSYQETTQITGGSLLSVMKIAGALSSQARQATSPIVANVYLKGNRMAHASPQSIEIVDLDKQTITSIDTVKRTYTIVTFEQMKEQLAQAEKAMEEKQAEAAAPASGPNAAADANDNAKNVKMSFDVHVRKTGATQQVSGLDTNEAILTLMMNATDTSTQQKGAMGITNDMWLAAEIPGYDQLRAFNKRMTEQMGQIFSGSGVDMSRMLNGQPGANQALSDLAKQMQEVQGVPVLQVMRMGATNNGQPLPAASEAPLPTDSGPKMPSAGDVAKQSASSAISSRLGGLGGGFGGFGHKKKPAPEEQPAAAPAAQADGQAPPPTSAVLMETRTESSGFSTDPVDEAHFRIPEGYMQVETTAPNAGR